MRTTWGVWPRCSSPPTRRCPRTWWTGSWRAMASRQVARSAFSGLSPGGRIDCVVCPEQPIRIDLGLDPPEPSVGGRLERGAYVDRLRREAEVGPLAHPGLQLPRDMARGRRPR